MARVPTYDSFQASANTLPQNRFDAPAMPDIAGRQAQQQGIAMQQAGSELAKAAMDAQERANQLRIDDAINKATEERLRLAYDKDVGFTNVKGDAVMNRSSGKPLADEYGEKYKQTLTDISDSLGNDEQKRVFMQRASGMLSSFHGSAMQHEAVEYRNHEISVRQGTMDSRARQIALEWHDRNSVAESVKSIDAAAYNLAILNGKSGIEAEEFAKKEASRGHVVAISSALNAGNIGYANSYLAKYRESIDINHLVSIDQAMNQHINVARATEAVNSAHKSMTQEFNPDERTKVHGVIEMLESSGRRYDKNGNLLSNPASTAKGEMQVLDGTAKDPGLGVKPAQDNSPEERARVGHDYLDALLNRYGRVDQAMAAYKLGFGNVDAAIAKAKNPKNETGGDWYSFLDQTTKDYLNKAGKMLDAGMGAPTRPSELKFVESAVAALGPNARPEQIKTTTEAAKQRFVLIEQDRKQKQDEIYTDVQQRLISNGGDFAQIPVGLINQVDPDQREKLRKFAEAEKKGPVKVTDDAVYYRLSQMPAEEFSKVNLLEYRHQLADTEFKGMVMRQQNIGGKNTEAMAKDHNLKAELKLLEGQLTTAGVFLNASEKQAVRVETRDRFMGELNRVVEAEEKATNKPVTGDRVRQIASSMLVRVAGDPQARMLKDNEVAWKLMVRAYDDIPANQRSALERQLKTSDPDKKITRMDIVDAWRKGVLQSARDEEKKRNAPL